MRHLFLVIVVAFGVLAAGCGGSGGGGAEALTVNTGPAPWPDPDQVDARIKAAGLESAPVESLVVHYHSHLDLFVNGRSEPVAASIGREDQSLFSPLHTHATSGMIHIEAPSAQRITLRELFTEWGVRLTDKCIGGYCLPQTLIKAYIDGKAYSGPIAKIVLKKGEEIALVIGSKPAQVPSAWNCRANIDPKVEALWQCKDFSS